MYTEGGPFSGVVKHMNDSQKLLEQAIELARAENERANKLTDEKGRVLEVIGLTLEAAQRTDLHPVASETAILICERILEAMNG